MRILGRRPVLGVVLASSLGVAVPAWGQEPTPSPAKPPQAADAVEPARPKPSGRIEEIVVTAERREASAQDIGQAISVFSWDNLERQGIEDIHDLGLSVPSLHVTGGLPQLTLRGIGNDIVAPGVDPGFALHVNGIYASQLAIALLDFYDLERVEVLYGPQGTLYGRNTTGGSVNFVTRRPTQEFEFASDLEVSSFEKVRLRSTLNLPLVSDQLASRFTWNREWPQKPYQVKGLDGREQELPVNTVGQGDSLRGTLAWTPRDDFQVDLIAAWSRDNYASGLARQFDFPVYPIGQHPIFGGAPDYTGGSGIALGTGQPVCPDCPKAPEENDALRPHLDLRTSQRIETWWAQAIVSWDVGPVTFKSNSNYQYWDYLLDKDQDGSELRIERLVLEDKHITWTQELTLQSKQGGRLDWLFGVNYQYDTAPDTELLVWDSQSFADGANFFILDPFSPTLEPSTRCVGGAACTFLPLDPAQANVHLNGRVETEVLGIFGNAWFDLTDQVRLSGGVRYSYTHRDADDTSIFDSYLETFDAIDETTCPSAGFPLITDPAVCFALLNAALYRGALDPATTAFQLRLDAQDPTSLNAVFGTNLPETGSMGQRLRGIEREKSWNSITGNFKIEYRPRPESLLYASVATGERAGGFNWLEPEPFDEEKVLAYEIGAKNTFFDDRMLLNVFAFYYDYDDRFTTQTLENVPITQNADSAEVFGLELQIVALPIPELRLNATFGYLHAEFDSTFFAQDPSLGPDGPTGGFDPTAPPGDQHGLNRPPENIKGNRLPRSPEYSVSFGAEYLLDLGRWGSLTPRADFYWRDEVQYQQFENPLDRQGSYHRTDFRLRYDPRDSNWWIEGFVHNLENEQEIKTNLESTESHRQWYLAEPRVVGVRAGLQFTRAEVPWF